VNCTKSTQFAYLRSKLEIFFSEGGTAPRHLRRLDPRAYSARTSRTIVELELVRTSRRLRPLVPIC